MNPNAGKGKGVTWLRANAGHQGDDCLIWPFAGDGRGYGHFGLDGKILKAHRFMCELAHGKPPTPGHETAHTCGRGNQGCVNPRHLAWKTRSENQQDRRRHGTHGKGRWLRVSSKLTPEKVAQIRAIGSAMNKEALGRKFGVTPAQIARILDRRAWKVDGEYPKRGWAVTPYRRSGSR